MRVMMRVMMMVKRMRSSGRESTESACIFLRVLLMLIRVERRRGGDKIDEFVLLFNVVWFSCGCHRSDGTKL
jgi:hypothetical protein